MHMTEEQRQLTLRYMAHIESADDYEKRARMEHERADDTANELIESFRGQLIPETIVTHGRVLAINRAMLTTEHTNPHHGVRLVTDAIVE